MRKTLIPELSDVMQTVGRTPDGKKIGAEKASLAATGRVIPSMAYTDPEVAWVGLTEDSGLAPKASRSSRACSPGPNRVARLPIAATKVSPNCCLMTAPEAHGHGKILGGGIVGTRAAWLRRLRTAVARMCRRRRSKRPQRSQIKKARTGNRSGFLIVRIRDAQPFSRHDPLCAAE